MPPVLEQHSITPLLRSEDFPTDSRIQCPEAATSDALDEALIKYHQSGNPDRKLLIDFSRAVYIDIAALINCISLLVARHERGHATYISYPKTKRTRDFLAVWRFPEAVLAATNKPLVEFLLFEERRFLTEDQDTYRGIGSALAALEFDPDWRERGGTPGRRNFFEFTTFNQESSQSIVPEGLFASIPRMESKRWTGPLVEQVLRKHLGRDTPKDEVARVIIFEAVSNAVRHPNAHTIQVVSKLSYRELPTDVEDSAPEGGVPERIPGRLQICIWDDGDSIASTLLRVAKDGKRTRSFKLPEYMCDKIFVQVRRADLPRKVREEVVDESQELDSAATEPRALLASLFPGVSRAAALTVPDVEAFEQRANTEADRVRTFADAPGMGLYALRRTVIDQFQGKLVIRSGNYRLVMENAHDAWRVQHKARYKCKITQYPEGYPEFRGNLVTIHLPLRDPR